ncbi:ComGF family competence protein [Virgibacillus alimentarius]|nr:ComGF family competence protein [Virgibacillus alimentarius]
MLKKEMKKYVYMGFWKNERGFTFLSMLFTITVLLITIPLLAYIISSANYSSNHNEIAVHQFFHFLQNDVIHAASCHVSNNTVELVLEEDEEFVIASIEMYKDLIRRQVDGKGHEIYLRDIREFNLKSLPYGFKVTIVDLQGERYEKTISFYN